METLSSFKSQDVQDIVADYQDNIHLALHDLKKALNILESASDLPKTEQDLEQNIDLAQNIINQTIARLNDLAVSYELELSQENFSQFPEKHQGYLNSSITEDN